MKIVASGMRHTTIELPHVREDSCGTVHDTLELVCCRPRYARQEAVAIGDGGDILL